MKREADGDMGSPQKRSRLGDEEVRLLIRSKVAGSIIGKGGQNITKLRNQYKASITVPDCPGPERMLTLSSDLDTICKIIREVVPNMEENVGRRNLDLRMMIHLSQAGCVIGKSGSKIKELREKTGARIKIFSNMAPQSTDRIIQIMGDDEQCVNTIREIVLLVKSNPIKGIVNNYNPHNFDEFFAEDYGGWGSPNNNDRRGGNGTVGRQDSGIRNDGPRESPFTSRFTRPPQRGLMGGSFNDRPLGGNLRGASFGSGSRSLNGSSGGGGGPFDRNGWNSGSGSGGLLNPPNILGGGGLGSLGGLGGGGGDGKTTTQVTIPKDLAGAIIGKGGSRIRKIRQESGADITIDEPLPGSNDRIITIVGMPNQIQMAQYLLQQSVHNNTDRRY